MVMMRLVRMAARQMARQSKRDRRQPDAGNGDDDRQGRRARRRAQRRAAAIGGKVDVPEPDPVTYDVLAARIGESVAVSRWRTIDQPMIDLFADLTNDHQFIHVDPERARATPFGGTVAHGFLTLSIFGGLAAEVAPRLAGGRMGINYGFDRVRFVTPVRSGAKVRAQLRLEAIEKRDPSSVDIRYDGRLDVEGEDRPAIAAQWLVRIYLDERTGP
jgi:acyl dehydratase